MIQLQFGTTLSLGNSCCVKGILSHIEYIKRYLPPDGAVYVLQVTEKQYQSMKLLTGKKQIIEEKLTIDKTIIF